MIIYKLSESAVLKNTYHEVKCENIIDDEEIKKLEIEFNPRSLQDWMGVLIGLFFILGSGMLAYIFLDVRV